MSSDALHHGAVDAALSQDAAQSLGEVRQELAATVCSLAGTLCAAMDAIPGFVPCGHAFAELLAGVNGLLTYENISELRALTEQAQARGAHVCDHRGVEPGVAVAPQIGSTEAALLWAATRGIAADAWHGMRAGVSSDGVNVFVARALFALATGEQVAELSGLAGEVAREATKLA